MNKIEHIATTDGIGAAEAQAWLELLGMPTKEKVILPSTNKALRRRAVTNANPITASSVLSAYPNPSNGPVYLVYTVPEGVEHVRILVHDATGRLVLSEGIGAISGIHELPGTALASGLHIASLLFDGILVATAKVEVVR